MVQMTIFLILVFFIHPTFGSSSEPKKCPDFTGYWSMRMHTPGNVHVRSIGCSRIEFRAETNYASGNSYYNPTIEVTNREIILEKGHPQGALPGVESWSNWVSADDIGYPLESISTSYSGDSLERVLMSNSGRTVKIKMAFSPKPCGRETTRKSIEFTMNYYDFPYAPAPSRTDCKIWD